ncbi:recombinase family protein [Methylocystis heyeri]|uniref:Resolvase n=1 Tax=Methylocystis heyeri TaxID=391905 RepID=A0A6B8KIW4_9HYPH|nr:recombinase family protein [Methylocystis heyeri]QGM46470.1 resolvase [Methylocystis heyeri]
MLIHAYLRASTQEQDANRARAALKAFADQRGLRIAGYYAENESGASLKRPELFKLIDNAERGDVLLLEQVDRLSRLNAEDWEALKATIKAKGVRIVALDLPTSWTMATTTVDAFTARMFEAINDMMLDMLAAIARKDYEDRRRRQAEGIEKAKDAGLYKGRPEDAKRNAAIATLLREGKSWSQIQDLTKCARATVAAVSKKLKEEASAA